MGKKRGIEVGTVGQHYGKFDLERVGFFDDPPNGPHDKYQSPLQVTKPEGKERQIIGGEPFGLFEKRFIRILAGEALTEPYKDVARAAIAAKKKNIGTRPFLSPGSQWHSTPDDWFGCIGPAYSHFSPLLKESKTKKVEHELANCKIKPNPLGGPGYVDICLNPYPKHSNEPYHFDEKDKKGKERESEGKFLSASAPLDYFPPNPYMEKAPGPTYVPPPDPKVTMIGTGHIYVPGPKDPGGDHSGCFSKFPEYQSNPYHIHEKYVPKPRWVGGGPTFRSKYSNSIIEQGTRISCNANNYPEYTERVYPLPV